MSDFNRKIRIRKEEIQYNQYKHDLLEREAAEMVFMKFMLTVGFAVTLIVFFMKMY